MKIEVKNVSKTFRRVEVIRDVSVTFESGKIYGLVGKNGSGKSVFLKMLCSFYIPNKGVILQDGYNYIKRNEFPKSTRALIDKPNFISDLTGFENLKALAKINGNVSDEEILKVMEDVNLLQDKDKLYWEYSLGMKQKLGIAQVLMEDVDFMIFDEPFIAVDEESVQKIKTIIKSRMNKDKIIIMTSHIMDDINELCDEVYEFKYGVLTKYEV